MKALTLHQPWAWLVANGLKEVETRSWYTPYRGPLAVHAGRHRDPEGELLWLNQVDKTFMHDLSFGMLPFGYIVATCNVIDCISTPFAPIPEFTPAHGWEIEQRFGNYAPGRWAWILRDVLVVDPPVKVHGWQRLWNWTPPEILSSETGLRP